MPVTESLPHRIGRDKLVRHHRNHSGVSSYFADPNVPTVPERRTSASDGKSTSAVSRWKFSAPEPVPDIGPDPIARIGFQRNRHPGSIASEIQTKHYGDYLIQIRASCQPQVPEGPMAGDSAKVDRT